MTLVVNMMGGPGAGKSTMAASVFSELKWKGYEVELVTEFAKDKVWEEATKILDNQLYIFARQEQRVNRLDKKVDIIITDSSILLTLIYAKTEIHKGELFKELVLAEYNKYDNLNIFLNRNDYFVENGRNHTLEQSIEKDIEIKNLMDNNSVTYDEVAFDKESVSKIVGYIIKKVN